MLYIVLTLFLLVTFSSFFEYEEKVRNFLFFCCWVACIAVAGFRIPGCDKDSLSYLAAFNEDIHLVVEPSFYLISSIVKFCCGPDFLFVLFIYAFIGVSTKFLAIRQLTNLWMLSCLVYIANFFILQDMTQIRGGVASGMLLLCIKPLYDRRWSLFLLFAGIGIAFHSSALLILPFWFLGTKSFNKYFYLLLLVFAYCFFYMGFTVTQFLNYIPIDYIQQKIQHNYEFQSWQNSERINPFTVFQTLRICIAGILVWKLERIAAMNKYFLLLLKIYFLGIISFLLFTDLVAYTVRISEFLEIVEIILIPLLIYTFKDRRIGVGLLICITVFFISMGLFYSELIS